jgi:hypothetical protein
MKHCPNKLLDYSVCFLCVKYLDDHIAVICGVYNTTSVLVKSTATIIKQNKTKLNIAQDATARSVLPFECVQLTMIVGGKEERSKWSSQ